MNTTTNPTTIETTAPAAADRNAAEARQRRRRVRRGMSGVLVGTALALVLGACSTGPSTPGAGSAPGGSAQSTTGESAASGRARTRGDEPSNPVEPAEDATNTKMRLHRPNNNPNPMVTSSGWENMEDFLWFVVKDADAYWTSIQTGAGLAEPQVRINFPLPGKVAKTACGPTDDTSMFYCPTDDTIVFSQQLAVDLWNGTYVGPDGQRIKGKGGDMAPAIMVAHEFAHSIQAEYGISKKDYGTPRTEKHADCWAGVWVRNAGERGLLDEGDVQEAVNTAFLVGDSQVTHAEHHGTSAERMAAFKTGYGTTDPRTCDVYLES